jgi:uncharacterized protein (DUF1697 family)
VPKYVAFLRAINVGGHTVKMDHLRELFASLGFANVETFIASGNVIFDSTARNTATLEKKIEAFLLKSLSYEVKTFLRTPGELSAVAEYKPFPDSELKAEGNVLYIGFLPRSPTAEAEEKLVASKTDVDEFHLHGREMYWLLRTSFSESKFSGGRLEKFSACRRRCEIQRR